MNNAPCNVTRRSFITTALSASGGLALGFFYPGRAYSTAILPLRGAVTTWREHKKSMLGLSSSQTTR